MKFYIRQSQLQDEIKTKIYEGFAQHAVEAKGFNGLDEKPIAFEIFSEQEFVGAIVVQLFWGELHIKYLFVEKRFRGQGAARELMCYACEFGRRRGCRFAFVETMDFQAPDFYQKMGFEIEFSRPCSAGNTVFYYLKKELLDEALRAFERRITRVGVYGVCLKEGKMLLIKQKKGPYNGKLDFPGGGIEFGESPEQAMRLELAEEVAMEFDSCRCIYNLTATVVVPATKVKPAYALFQVGMIYSLEGCRASAESVTEQEFEPIWLDPKALQEDQCSKLLWKYLNSSRQKSNML